MKKLIIASVIFMAVGWGQQYAPTITATAKAANQINLTWPAVKDPGYGYVVEVQSSGDSRYSAYTVVQPIPTASGYLCDSTRRWPDPSSGFLSCASTGGPFGYGFGDPDGVYVLNLAAKFLPPWVTESQYIDRFDGTRAQWMMFSLKPNTTYNFRVRCFIGFTGTTYGPYSNVATATTPNPTVRHVATTGNDSTGDGSSGNPWATINYGVGHTACGEVLMIAAGEYGNDTINDNSACTNSSRKIIMATPGAAVTISTGSQTNYIFQVYGSYFVLDGITEQVYPRFGTYAFNFNGDHNGMVNCKMGPPVVPADEMGVWLTGNYNLLQGNYLHDMGSPAGAQNPNGQSGFLIEALGGNAIIQYNHLTRGAHDGLHVVNANSIGHRVLNNVFDGGWGMGPASNYDAIGLLIEGNWVYANSRLEFGNYKPSIGQGTGHSTVRRNHFLLSDPSYGLGKCIEVISYHNVQANAGQLWIYNNVCTSGTMFNFNSSRQGATYYAGNHLLNNIHQGFDTRATEWYTNDPATLVSHNSLLMAGGSASTPMVNWWIDSNVSPYIDLQTIGYADTNYGPFKDNARFSVPALFLDEAHLDYHLAPNSPLKQQAMVVQDPNWPLDPDVVARDLGPWGIVNTGKEAAITGKVLAVTGK